MTTNSGNSAPTEGQVAQIANKEVSIKIVGVESPKYVWLKEWSKDGIWVQSQTLHAELAMLTEEKGIPEFLGRNPIIFLPHQRLEWLMAVV